MPQTSWNIRVAKELDAGVLSVIGAATFVETFAGILDGLDIVSHCEMAHSRNAYQAYLREGGNAWLAETENGHAPIGFALMTTPDLPSSKLDGSDIELKRIYVLSRFHGSGVGSGLLEVVVSAARKSRANRLLLGVYAGNDRAIAFYKKQGFKHVADRQFQVGGKKYDDLVFAKELNR